MATAGLEPATLWPLNIFPLTLTAASLGKNSLDHIWQCGCGLEHPIVAPRFSKICTHRNRRPKSPVKRHHSSTTLTTSSVSINGNVKSVRGWKHITLQSPRADEDLSKGCRWDRIGGDGASGNNAGKSLSKTVVDS